MRDVVLLAALVGFFALAAVYVRWADHLVGPNDRSGWVGPSPTDPEDER